MLISLLKGQLDFTSAVIGILATLMIIFLVLPFHEWAHAFTASKLGDTSVKYRGRLTLNPLAHIDPFGSLALLLFGFGWAKPVPIDSRNFKRPKLYMAITAVMGPLANVLAALVGALALNLMWFFWRQPIVSMEFVYYVFLFFWYYTDINIFLAVFNFLPIPPLDGSKVLFMFLPDRWVNKIYQYQMYITIAFLVLLYTKVLSIPIEFLGKYVIRGLMWLTGLPFGQDLSPIFM